MEQNKKSFVFCTFGYLSPYDTLFQILNRLKFSFKKLYGILLNNYLFVYSVVSVSTITKLFTYCYLDVVRICTDSYSDCHMLKQKLCEKI